MKPFVPRLKLDPGDKLHRLTYIRDLELRPKRLCLWKCECGNEKSILLESIRSGNTVSCGCKHSPHGMSRKHPMYSAWMGMRSRSKKRGIPHDSLWDTFPGFLDNQPPGEWFPGACLCRTADQGAYGPTNARWDTKRANGQEAAIGEGRAYLMPDGRLAADVARANGVDHRRWRMRVQREGWSPEDAVSIPVRAQRRRTTRA